MKKQWKSLGDLNNQENLKDFKQREFQEGHSVLEEDVSRRTFLKLLGGTTALAGLTGCKLRKPYKKIQPYARKVEYIIPGKPVYYATSMSINESVTGLLVETHEGRPTKIEGNPEYEKANGGTSSFHQASVLDLYDPDRLKDPYHSTKKSTISSFQGFLSEKRESFADNQGEGLCILTEQQMSPTFYRLLSNLKKKYPKAECFRYESVNSDNSKKGIFNVTNQFVRPSLRLADADVVVSLQSDFLGNDSGQLKNIADFTSRRDPDSKLKTMNRLYVFEDRVSVTGTKADHRYPVRSSDTLLLLNRLLFYVSKKMNFDVSKYVQLKDVNYQTDYVDEQTVEAVADDLCKNRGKSVVVAGDSQDQNVHSLVFLLNSILGNNFKTIDYHKIDRQSKDLNKLTSIESLSNLVTKLNAQEVDTLVILGGDPITRCPHDFNLSEAIVKAKDRIHLTSLKNSTSKLCNWVIPRSHYLESWSDNESITGSFSLCQPVIRRMYNSLTDNELMSLLSTNYKSDYVLTRSTWKYKLVNFEQKWNQSLHDGLIYSRYNKVYPDIVLTSPMSFDFGYNTNGLELSFYSDYKVYDGRFSNNSWLQELPDPITKLTWDNAAYISPKTASKLGLTTGDNIELSVDSQKVIIPIFISPGHSDQSISVSEGYGEYVDGKVGSDIGVSVQKIRTQNNYNFTSDIVIVKQKGKYDFATTQDHGYMEGRPHFRYADKIDYDKNPYFAQEAVEYPTNKPLWNEFDYSKGYQWGMVIDLNKCTSCNACIVGCQSENNIPVVGKEEVKNGREMHWLRIDRYYEGDDSNPKIVEQPVTCLQCEMAPCEQVCPAAATVHDKEGLNSMIYNRCIGTRYCADNCPAKVRRFNFFDYHQRNPHSKKKDRFHLFDYMREPDKTLQQQFNPDVTVRMRGVMEKCTYCVQRIKQATQDAKNEDRTIRDGEVITACQQACPADAIVMGNILDEKSKVFELRKKKLHYSILEQLMLKPRTTYIAAIYNPNPVLIKDKKQKEHHGSQH